LPKIIMVNLTSFFKQSVTYHIHVSLCLSSVTIWNFSHHLSEKQSQTALLQLKVFKHLMTYLPVTVTYEHVDIHLT